MESTVTYWWYAVYSMLFIIFTPFSIVNRFAFAWLTEQPFIWVETSMLDLATIVPYLFILVVHIEGMYAENSGLGLQENPSHKMMYVENYNILMAMTEYNPSFFCIYTAFFSFMRVICSLIVTQSLGPIISTIMYMFKDILLFLSIWLLVVLMFF